MVGRWHLFLFGARPISWVSGSVLPTENPPMFPGDISKIFSLRSDRPKTSPGTLPKWRIYGATFVLGVPLIGSSAWVANVSPWLLKKRNEKRTLTRWQCDEMWKMIFRWVVSWFSCEFSFFFFLRFWGAHSRSLTNHICNPYDLGGGFLVSTQITSPKMNECPLSCHFKRKGVFQPSTFRGYVSFQGGYNHKQPMDEDV